MDGVNRMADYHRLLSEVEDYAIIMLDVDGNIVDWNKGAEKIKGYRASEILGKNFKIFYTSQDHFDCVPEKMLQEAKLNGKATSEGWRIKKNGSKFWGSVVITALHNEKKELTGFGKITRDLTEKKLTEERLRKSERRMSSIIEHNAGGFILVDENMRVTYASPNSEKILGYPPLEITGQFRIELVHPDCKDRILEAYRNASENPHVSYLVDYQMRNKNNEYIWVEGTFTNWFDEPDICSMIINYRNITERKKVERTLQQSESNLRLIMDLVPHLIFAKDRFGRFVFANKRFCDLYGIEHNNLLGRKIVEVIPNIVEGEKFMQDDEQIINSGQPEIFPENEFTDAQGLKHIFYTTKVPFTPSGSSEKAVLAVAVEITDIKKTEEKLMISEARHRGILESQTNYVIRTDLQGNYSFYNNKFLNDFGWLYDGDGIIGHSSMTAVMDYHHQRVIDIVTQCLEYPNQVFHLEIDKPKQGGGIKTTIWDFICLVDANGKPTEMQCVGIDISDRKAVEIALQESETELKILNAELEERVLMRTGELIDANQELEAFSYTASHDLRTPIRAIQIFGNLLQNKMKAFPDDDVRTYLDNILKCSVEMNDLINDLLTFSKLGRQELNKIKIDMTSIAKEVVDSVMSVDENANVKIQIDELPQVSADPTLVRSIWLNLIGNAVKYCRTNVVCTISIKGKIENNLAVYIVEDNGIGFSMKYYDKLFKPFSRLHNASEYKGTGAGLAICDRIIKKHGGNIWAESVANEGSKFFFTLPSQ